jgi:hypothetical protein
VFVSIAFLGVGAGVRRDLSATLERLGIRFPTVGDWVSGGITALLCLAVLVVFSLWNQAINPTEITDQQAIASDQLMVALGQSYAMVGLAALSAGVGKRCYFGGRYNPCSGILPTGHLLWVAPVPVSIHALVALGDSVGMCDGDVAPLTEYHICHHRAFQLQFHSAYPLHLGE